jgi:hypothetical protein
MNGNLPANRRRVTGIIPNLALQPGDTLWIRWSDFDSESFDDGLAIDSFSLAAVSSSALLRMEFLTANTVIREDSGTVRIPVVIRNKSSFLSQVEVFIADRGTIDTATDIRLSSAYVSFPGSLPDTIAYFNFGVINTQPFEGGEYFVLGLRNPVNGGLGAIIYDTIRIFNYQYPAVPIAALRGDDAQGRPDSLGRSFAIEGIVHGVNYSATGGLDFYVLQNGSGINVYGSAAGAYIPAAGDRVKVWGRVGQFRGLTRLESLDSVQLVSSGNPLETPARVNRIGEGEESSYLQLDSLKLYPPIAQWPSNLEVQAVRAGSADTITIYVSANTDLAGMPAPQGYFSITGLGSQFNPGTNAPFNSGYRLMAASRSSVISTSVPATAQRSILHLAPNPFHDRISLSSSTDMSRVTILGMDGRTVYDAPAGGRSLTIPTDTWAPGVYIIEVTTGDEVVVNKMIRN